MNDAQGKTRSLWQNEVKFPDFPSLRGKTSADVCIVGAGIAGLTTAYFLAKEGLSVIVLDQFPIGGGQTGRTSAHLASAIDDRFVEIERLRGKKASRLAHQSHAAAIDAIEKICRNEKFDCQFLRLDGVLSRDPESPAGLLRDEFAAAKRAGFTDIELLNHGGLDDGPCIRFGGQGRFHPLRYVAGLLGALQKLGVKIHTGKRVKDVQGSDPKTKLKAVAKLQGGARVSADHIVVATNTPAPINDWMGIYTKQASYQSYVIGLEAPAGSIKDALYWDTGDPYHYVRLQARAKRGSKKAADILIVGGEDHKTGQPPAHEDPFAKLQAWTKAHFPTAGKVVYRWSGQVQEPDDGLAFIGRAMTKKQEVFVITGDSGMGLTHATIGGMVITDLIMGRKNPWVELYDPSRKMMNLEFVEENANTLAQYKDFITAGDVKSAKEIRKGEGAILRSGLKKLAIYRDEKGAFHRCSAVCTHLQCIVRWNGVEKTWDCPCHGSRFGPTGEVMMGPAVDDLASAS